MTFEKKTTLKMLFKRRILEPLKEALREVWGYGTGKAGLFLLFSLIIISLYALAIMPPNYGNEVWFNSKAWEENPVLAPPEWVKYFGYQYAPHVVEIVTSSDIYRDTMTQRIVANYSIDYELPAKVFPQGIVVKVHGIKVYKTAENRFITPLVVLLIERPDGIVFKLSETPLSLSQNATLVSGRAYGNEGEYYVVRIDTQNAPVEMAYLLVKKYNITPPEELTGGNMQIASIIYNDIIIAISDAIKGDPAKYIFGRPVVKITRLDIGKLIKGYIATLENIRAQLESLGLGDEASQLANIIDSLEILSENISISQVISTLDTAVNNVEQLAKKLNETGVVNIATIEKLMSVSNDLKQFRDKIQQTKMLYDITVTPVPVTGKYRIVLQLSYPPDVSGLTNPASEVKMVVKGTIYGFMGTDDIGRDLAQGLLFGFPVALAIGVLVAFVTTSIGLLLGVVSGYYGGIIDEIIQRIVDVLGNIPLLPILILIANIAIVMFADPMMRLFTILATLMVFGWGGLAIITRSMTLSIKEEPYIEAARALGAGNKRIIFKHIIPQIIPYAVASMVFSVPNAILTEAGLSVLGIRHGFPTWGSILAEAREAGYLYVWWWIIPPGLLISITSLTFVMLGMAIERIVEPRLRTV